MKVSTLKRKSVIFFIFSIFFFFIYLFIFNYELDFKADYATHDLKRKSLHKIKITDNNINSIRILISKGSSRNLANFNIPINVTISGSSGVTTTHNLKPKGASTGGGKRYYSILNYDVFVLPEGRFSEVEVSVSNEVNKFKKFTLIIKKNPSNFYVYFFGVIFLLLLFMSIKYRENTFKGKITRAFPYTLYFFVSLLVLSWNI